jgi:hypothetical protein
MVLVFFASKNICIDAHPNLLKDSNVNFKMKTMKEEEEKVGACF